MFLSDAASEVGKPRSQDSLQKYTLIKRNFEEFLRVRYDRKDIGLNEFSKAVVMDFERYVATVGNCSGNTTHKKVKMLKTIVLYAINRGFMHHNPYAGYVLKRVPVNRGFLTDEEILSIANKDFGLKRLELVRDIFIFSCFTGLAYIDVANLTPDHIVTMGDKQWIMTQRQKTSISTNVLLLDIPKSIIAKYGDQTYREGKLFPILSNQKTNSYLKEIADLCGIKKNLTFHSGRHRNFYKPQIINSLN